MFALSVTRMDGWMNGVLGHFYALSRLSWAEDNTVTRTVHLELYLLWVW